MSRQFLRMTTLPKISTPQSKRSFSHTRSFYKSKPTPKKKEDTSSSWIQKEELAKIIPMQARLSQLHEVGGRIQQDFENLENLLPEYSEPGDVQRLKKFKEDWIHAREMLKLTDDMLGSLTGKVQTELDLKEGKKS